MRPGLAERRRWRTARPSDESAGSARPRRRALAAAARPTSSRAGLAPGARRRPPLRWPLDVVQAPGTAAGQPSAAVPPGNIEGAPRRATSTPPGCRPSTNTAGRPRAARRPGRRVVALREVVGMLHPARPARAAAAVGRRLRPAGRWQQTALRLRPVPVEDQAGLSPPRDRSAAVESPLDVHDRQTTLGVVVAAL